MTGTPGALALCHRFAQLAQPDALLLVTSLWSLSGVTRTALTCKNALQKLMTEPSSVALQAESRLAVRRKVGSLRSGGCATG